MNYKRPIKFKDHMKDRTGLFDKCTKVTIGTDFAVFEFDDKDDLKKATELAEKCNKIYHYTFESNLVNKLACFNTQTEKE